MRTIARVFVVLFCITFLANQALSADTALDRLATLVQKLMLYSTNALHAHAQGLGYLEKRIALLESELQAQTEYDKNARSFTDKLVLQKKETDFKKATEGYQAASKELFDYVERLTQ